MRDAAIERAGRPGLRIVIATAFTIGAIVLLFVLGLFKRGGRAV